MNTPEMFDDAEHERRVQVVCDRIAATHTVIHGSPHNMVAAVTDDLTQLSQSAATPTQAVPMTVEEQEKNIQRLERELAHWKRARHNALECGDILKRENEQLRAELAAAQKDAERYQFLRDMRHEAYGRGNLIKGMFGDNLDAVIDAALVAKEEKK